MPESSWKLLCASAEHALLAADCADTDGAPQLYAEAERKARLLIERRPSLATGYHLLALSWYGRPDSSTERSKLIASALSTAHELDPEDMFVQASLACHAFDEGDYGTALKWLGQLDSGVFVARGQQWRILKHAELAACCRLHQEVGFDESGIEDLVDSYLATESEDRPMPTELVHTTLALATSGRADSRHVGQVLRLLDGDEYTGVYHQERAALNQWQNEAG